MIFDLSAMVKAADPRTGRDTAYEFGDRIFLDPGYTPWPVGVGNWIITAGPAAGNPLNTWVVAPGSKGVGYEKVGDGTSTAWDVLLIDRPLANVPDWLKHEHYRWATGDLP